MFPLTEYRFLNICQSSELDFDMSSKPLTILVEDLTDWECGDVKALFSSFHPASYRYRLTSLVLLPKPNLRQK
jgi:hypothetical protein